MEKISVIIPCYNVENRIKKCLDSLINQTYENIELICINDGSTDKTLSILKEYQKKNKEKIKLISRENRGISATRNEGLDIASGKYIGFVDSDDYVETDMYKKLYQKLISENADIVFCDYYEIGKKSKRGMRVGRENFSGNLKNNPELFNTIWYAPWNKLYKRELFDDIRFPLDTKYEDLNAILKVFDKAHKIVKLDEPLYNYVLNEMGETFTINEKVFDIFKIFEDLTLYFSKYKNDKKIYNEYEKLVCNTLFDYVKALILSNKFNYDFIYKFYKTAHCMLNDNFKGWKFKYVCNSNSFSQFKTRLLQINDYLYFKYIKKKRKLKKDILFTGFTITTGGVSKALINLLNNIDTNKFNVTLILQIKGGELQKYISKDIKVRDYNLNKSNIKLLKKIINILKYIHILLVSHNKYDFSACFESGYPLSSLLALTASKNNACWMHTNIIKYMEFSNWYNNIEDPCIRAKHFINRMKFRRFKYKLFVSNDAMKSYLSLYPNDDKSCFICHNFIDYKSIIKNSNEKIDLKKQKEYTFLNVSRHTEYDKRITLLIEACKILKDENIKFKMILVGDGEDHKNYVSLVNQYNLNDNVIFTGLKNNPYPYYKISDCFVLTSNFEGYPVVFNESLVMNIPIITTNISDAEKDINNKYGTIVNADSKDISKVMKKYIKENKRIVNQFDYKKFNSESMMIIERMINNEI